MTADSDRADHRDAARCIDDSHEAILAEWCEKVATQIEGAEDVDEPALLDDVPTILDLVADALREGTATALQDFEPVRQHGEQRAALTNASIRWVLTEIQLLRTVVIDDIEETLGELTREDLLLIYDFFEQVSTVSTEAYTNWQVRKEEEARKEAEKTVQELSRLTRLLEEERERRSLFVSAVVHDLRTPLSSMQIATELLDKFIDRPGVRENALEKLQRNVRRLDSMAQRLLDVNRISAGGRLPLDIEEVDLVDLAQSYVSDAQSTHGADKARLEVLPSGDQSAGNDTAGDVPAGDEAGEVRGWWNRQALVRILGNLVENGLQYGEPPVTVRIRVLENGGEESVGGGEQVCLEVHNAGPPIPPEEQERIFEQFVRLEDAQEKNRSGWGIGLTLVRGLITALGGRLELDSSEGEGTTFTIRLPRDARPFQEG